MATETKRSPKDLFIAFLLLAQVTFALSSIEQQDMLLNKYNHETSDRQRCESASVPVKAWTWFGQASQWPSVDVNATKDFWQQFAASIGPYDPSKHKGRGIVASSGRGSMPFLVAALRTLRNLGCQLPIEYWSYDANELNQEQRDVVEAVGNVRIRFVSEVDPQLAEPKTHEHGGQYRIKPASILYSAFEEVLLLDSDNFVTRDPTYLFDLQQYTTTGALFFGDYAKTSPENPIWQIFDVPCYDEQEFESGQLLINKRKGWKALSLALFLCSQNVHYHVLWHGDKDAFRFAWKATSTPYYFEQHNIVPVGYMLENSNRFCGHTMGHRDPNGYLLFLHANFLKGHNWVHGNMDQCYMDGRNGFRIAKPWAMAQISPHDPNMKITHSMQFTVPDSQVKCYGMAYIWFLPDKKEIDIETVVPLDSLINSTAFYKAFTEADGPKLVAFTPPESITKAAEQQRLRT